MAEEKLYRPRELYQRQLKAQYHRAAENYYEELASKAGTDKGANALHVKEYRAYLASLEQAKKRLGSAKTGKGFAIAGLVVFIALALIFLIASIVNAKQLWWGFIVAGVSALAVVGFIFLLKRAKKSVKRAQEIVDKLEKETAHKKEVCYQDMAGLNALLDDGMPQRIMEGETPLIDLDLTFSPERLCYLMDRFAMEEEKDPDTSVLGVVSGQVSGNPFVLEKVRRHKYDYKTYSGSLVIHWTTTYTDSKGNTQTQHHTQTLHATAEHLAPSYCGETRLIYGSEVAPHLHFTRRPSGAPTGNEKEMEKFVKHRIKELDKREQKALKNGGTFTKLGNDEFDALFQADDRDHEVEYRLLFTPLAQRNELDLIKNPDPYGDDFVMVKDGMLTSVASYHSQGFDYYATADRFAHYCFEDGKKNFVAYCDEFIKGLFFDLAPILSIPLYQNHKPKEYIYGGTYRSHLTSFEHEVLANRMKQRLFEPDGADSSLPVMLKEANAKPIGLQDEVTFSSFSYHTSPRVDLIPVLGGDGRWHDVPVHWTQYDRVETKRKVAFAESNKTRSAFNHPSLQPLKEYLANYPYHFERGFLAYFLGEKGSVSSKQEEELSSYFYDKE